MFIEAHAALLAIRSTRMLRFLHWYINKAVDLEMYLTAPLVDFSRSEHTAFMVGLLIILVAANLLIFVVAGIGAICDEDSTAAKISIAAVISLALSPFIVAAMSLLIGIVAILFILRISSIAFKVEDKLYIASDWYYKLRALYLEFKSKMKTRTPIKKQDCAYRSNYCPVCNREYNK